MPVKIYESQQGIFVAIETVSGTYTAPGSTAFIQTVDSKPKFNQSDSKSLTLDSLSRAVKRAFSTKKHHKLPFGVLLSWLTGAPTTTNLLPVHPLLLSCGAAAPVAITTPAAGVQYTEAASDADVKTVSISHRRTRSATNHYERQLAGARGQCKFTWKIGEVPRFDFDYVGAWKANADVAALAPTIGAQLTNLAQPSSAVNTATVQINAKSLCLMELVIDNAWRLKASAKEALCGVGAEHDPVDDSKITIKFRQPDIVTEFNPDLYWGNDYPFTITLKGDGALNTRSLVFSWSSLTVENVQEETIDGLVCTVFTLTHNNPTVLQLF